MSNRPAGGARSKKWERSPYDWYRESERVIEQLMHGIDFGDDLIWDPCCGMGNVLDVAKRYGHRTVGSDIVDRKPNHHFMRGNILSQIPRMPELEGRYTSVISNIPFSYIEDIGERVICAVLDKFSVRRAAFIVPIAFLASQDRWTDNKFAGKYKPSHTCIYRERHTMPPGHLIDAMPKPFDGGMADYAALVFTRPHRWRTETVWLSPGHYPEPPRRS